MLASLASKGENVYSLSAADLAAIQAALTTIESTTAVTNADLVANTAIVTDTNADLVSLTATVDDIEEDVEGLTEDLRTVRTDLGRDLIQDGTLLTLTKGSGANDSGYRSDVNDFGGFDGTSFLMAGKEFRTEAAFYRSSNQDFYMKPTSGTRNFDRDDVRGHRFEVFDDDSSTILYGEDAAWAGSIDEFRWGTDDVQGDPLSWIAALSSGSPKHLSLIHISEPTRPY